MTQYLTEEEKKIVLDKTLSLLTKLEEWRKKNGYEIVYVCKRLKITPQAYRNWQKRSAVPHAKKAYAIIKLIGLPMTPKEYNLWIRTGGTR